jgi:hypothetical protein
LFEKDRTVLTDDPTRAGEPGYVGRTEKADIVRLSVERAPGSSLMFAILGNKQRDTGALGCHSPQIEQHPSCYGANAPCCCQNTVPF